MLYAILKVIIRIGINLYYSEIRIRNKFYLNHDGPAIYIANHPNTLIDAWLIAFQSKKKTFYLTKGTFFNTWLKKKFLTSLNMVPVNRATEKKTEGVDNKKTFEACFQILEAGHNLVVFPEGNSFMELYLRKLKSGTARIALEAERRNHGNLKLKVIPIGLVYTQGEKFRSSIFVNCGQGMRVTEYLDLYEENAHRAARELTDEFRTMLESVLVTVHNKDQENLILELYEAIHKKYLKQDDVEEELDLMKKIRDRVELLSLKDPEKLKEIQSLNTSLIWKAKKLDIKNDFLDRKLRSKSFIRQILLSFIGILIGLPLFLFGFVHNIAPYQLTGFILSNSKVTKEYYAPIAILMGVILYPVNYILFIWLFQTYVSSQFFILLSYATLMPLLGLFAHWFITYLKHISFKLNYTFLLLNNKRVIVEMQEQRKQLLNLIFDA